MMLMALVTIIAGLNQNSAADTLIGVVAAGLVALMAMIYVR